MGNRTLVMLYNDQTHEWSNDPTLGKKIMIGTNYATSTGRGRVHDLGYGSVVECTHADNQTLALVDSYQYIPIAYSWNRSASRDELKESLLRTWADECGYRLVKKQK